MTHAAMDPEARAVARITRSLLRISVGIEAREDLLADVRAALARVRRARPAGLVRSTRVTLNRL